MKTPSPELPLVIILLGPTAVGKTQAAISLAQHMDAEIINADASLFYRGMDIGTAKPSFAERGKIPHHLIDVANPDHPWSLGKFLQEAALAVEDITQRGKLPLLVGGTGQYIRALVEGWQAPELAAESRLREVLEGWLVEIGSEALHNRLAVLDPQAAALIDYRNTRRTIRALEVILLTGRRFSDQRRAGELRFRTVQFGLSLPRTVLYERIDDRVDAMIARGLVEEVQSLLQRYSPDLAPFSAIGYREMIEYLQGKSTLDEAVVLMKRRTRQLVRRQGNWFKTTDPTICWLDAGDPAFVINSLAVVQEQIQKMI